MTTYVISVNIPLWLLSAIETDCVPQETQTEARETVDCNFILISPCIFEHKYCFTPTKCTYLFKKH
jgi:hypothetical protein